MFKKSSERLNSFTFTKEGKIEYHEEYISHTEEESKVSELFLKLYNELVDSNFTTYEDFGERQEDADMKLNSGKGELYFQITRTLDRLEHQKLIRDQIWNEVVKKSKFKTGALNKSLSIHDKLLNSKISISQKDVTTISNWLVFELDKIVSRINSDVIKLNVDLSKTIVQRHSITYSGKACKKKLNGHKFDLIVGNVGANGMIQGGWSTGVVENNFVIQAIEKKIKLDYKTENLNLLVWGRNYSIDDREQEIKEFIETSGNKFDSIYYLDMHYSKKGFGGSISRLHPDYRVYPDVRFIK